MKKDYLSQSFEEVCQKHILNKYGIFKPLSWFSKFASIYFAELQIEKELNGKVNKVKKHERKNKKMFNKH